ncbi:MAG: DUF2333 family protein [Alphaproteobacteria bacterium]|nr:DUF2333 family protein [Alphaproteobacteria bacterium]
MVKFNSEKFAKLAEKIKNIKSKSIQSILSGAKAVKDRVILMSKQTERKNFLSAIWNKIKKIKLKKTSMYKVGKKCIKKISDSWKIVLTFVPLFLIFYYVLGSKIVENIDVKTQYKIEKSDNAPLFMTADTMSFLIKREIDDKMWTPNLPPIFPAYILDNMPNFQVGIITAVRDITSTLRYFKHNTDSQNKDIKAAYKLLNYAPNVWIMSRKGKFNLAPSSNSQYRKAGNELRKFMRDGIYNPDVDDLRLLLKKISTKLQKLTLDSEDYQQENTSFWFNGGADDLFYMHKGYSFALWQISNTLCRDYKDLIVRNNLYEDWIRMSASLQKAAEFSPAVIRNGKVDSAFTPNHLLMQNYYLLRSISAALKIRDNLAGVTNAD